VSAEDKLTRESVLAALEDVKVPGTKVSVLKVDLIGEVRIDGDEVAVQIVRTTEKEETINAVGDLVAEGAGRSPRPVVRPLRCA